MSDRTIDSDALYKEAEQQTLETLPEFIEKIRRMFPTWKDVGETATLESYKNVYHRILYHNCIISTVLITYAAYCASSKHTELSLLQQGMTTAVIYSAMNGEKKNF